MACHDGDRIERWRQTGYTFTNFSQCCLFVYKYFMKAYSPKSLAFCGHDSRDY